LKEEMPKQVLVRDVPDEIVGWIDSERAERRLSQNDVIIDALTRVSGKGKASKGLFLAFPPAPVAETHMPPFSFIDLFAGIGGFRSALSKVNGRCLFSCEWDVHSQKTYKAWYGEKPVGNIRDVKMSDIPDHDVLAAGFPCQPFSIAGVSKRQSLGIAHGFECATQGTLFFQLATIIEAKRPPILFLENVKNLKSHDKGQTWQVIKDTLEHLDYWVFDKVIDAAGWVPQHRERIYIVCFDRKRAFPKKPDFMFPEKPFGPTPKVKDILEKNPDPKYTLTPHLWDYLQRYAEGHRLKGNGFGFGLVDIEGVSRTLSARYYKDGSEILIPQGKNKPPRRLSPKECARLMGFDEVYQDNIVVSDTQAYRQFGNAVSPRVIEAIGREISKVIATKLIETGCVLKHVQGTVERKVKMEAR
jgi:DNA (cytosine-5)-methyltransferase 1